MDIERNLTCKYCNKVYNEPITLPCGDSLCKQHINEILSIDDSNTFLCPFCNERNLNQNFKVSKTLQYLLDMEAHKITIDSKYERVFTDFKTEIKKLEAILNEPESFIYEEIHELKRQIDLDREKAKAEIDILADDFIQKLESFEKQFKAEWKSKVDLKHFMSLAETSKMQLKEYESCLNFLSNKTEERDQKTKQSEITIISLKSKIEELKRQMFSNMTIKYNPMKNGLNEVFGNLKIKNKSEVLGIVLKEFKQENVNSLVVLPNGDLVVGLDDGTIKILDTNDGTAKQTLSDHTRCINDLIFFDNNYLISASDDSTINIWNINEGSVAKTLNGHTKNVLALKMIRNDELASGSFDNTIKIWNLNDGTIKRTLNGHTSGVWSLELLHNGNLVSGSSDCTIKIWDVDTGMIIRTLTCHTGSVRLLKVLQNGDLVSASEDYSIKVWDVESGRVKRTLTDNECIIPALKVLDNGDLVSGDELGAIKIWDIETGTDKKEIKCEASINAIEVLQNGDLVSASYESIIIWD